MREKATTCNPTFMMTKDFQAKWRDEFVEHATNKQHRFITAWLHTALGKEKGGRTKHALRAIVPMTLINTVKVFDKLFRVDDCGMFLSSPSRFDGDLFRSLSYSEFKKWAGAIEIGSGRTFRRNVAKLREIGVLETIQNRQDDQGRWGEWKVRLNPFKIGFWVGATFSKAESCVRAEVSSPAATDGLLFSLMDSPLPAVASQPPVVANPQSVPRSKKKVLEPGGSRPSSKNTETIIRKNILATETGQVVEILKAVYPELAEAPVKLLKRVHTQVEAWMDSRRLTPGTPVIMRCIRPGESPLLNRLVTEATQSMICGTASAFIMRLWCACDMLPNISRSLDRISLPWAAARTSSFWNSSSPTAERIQRINNSTQAPPDTSHAFAIWRRVSSRIGAPNSTSRSVCRLTPVKTANST